MSRRPAAVPPGVGDSVPLSRPRRKAAKRCRASMTRPGPGRNAHLGTAVDKGPRGGVEVSCFLVGLHFSLPLFCFLVLNKRSAPTNTMSSIFTKKEAAARGHFRATASCHVELLAKKSFSRGQSPVPSARIGSFRVAHRQLDRRTHHIYFPRRLCAASRACRSDVYLSFSSSCGRS